MNILDYDILLEKLNSMKNITKQNSITTRLGYSIPYYTYGSGENHIVFVGGTHGSEIISVDFVLNLMDKISNKKDIFKNINEDDYTFHFIPVQNPEGFIVSTSAVRTLIPKNMEIDKVQKICKDYYYKYREDDINSKENPDFVLLGGDIVDERTTLQQMQQTFQALSTIQNQYGIYYVYGNHDQALYASQPAFTPEILKQTIEQNNIHILCDDSIRIQDEITLIGRDDRSHQRVSTSDLLQNVSSDDFLLLMDHQPVELDTNNQLQIDLQVSGHTHGGQMFPVGILSEWLGFGEMNYGYRQLSHMQVVVSSGIAGWGYPLRTGSQSEYLIINIQSQS